MDFEPILPPEEQPRAPALASHRLNSLRLIIFQPRQAFAAITSQKLKAGWLVPVILILSLAVIAALIATQATSRTTSTGISSTIRTTQTSPQQGRTTTQQSRTNSNSSGQGQQSGGFPAGPGGEFPGGGAVFPGGGVPGAATTNAQGSTASSTAVQTANPWVAAGLPTVSFMITWMLLGVLTNLFSLAFGGHSGTGMALTIAAWASIPLGARNLMQIMYYLATGAAIQAPGLSGFAPTPNSENGLILLQQILSRIDIYFFWQIGLLAVGVGVWGGISRKKSVLVAALAVVIILLLQALMALGLELLGNVNINTNMLLRLR